MNPVNLFSAILFIAFAIGMIILAFYAAAILAPIIAVAFLVMLVYSFLDNEPKSSKKRKRKKRR